MTADKRKDLVNEAVMLTRNINGLQERLDAIKKDLVDEAEKHKDEGTETEGGGVSLNLPGEECLCRVIFPAKSLIASFKKMDEEYAAIAKIAGSHFRDLFRAQTICKPVPDFRPLAKKLLGPCDSASLLKLCEKESKPTVSFEVTEKFGDDWP